MLRNPLLVPDLRELLHSGETEALQEFLSEQHPAHVAEIVEDLEEEGDEVLRTMAERLRAQVISYVSPEQQVRVVEAMTPVVAAQLLHLMSHDDRADLVNRLDEDRVDEILRHLAQAEREDIRRLASYETGTAGAVMTTDYATLPPNLTVRDAIDRLRHEAPDRETIDISFVVDSHHKLLGTVPLKRLVLARPMSRVLDHVMQRDVISARVDDDQESVARLVDKYDLFAIPILDPSDMLVGIVTHDDAMDILRQEQTEDILAFGGVTASPESEEEGYWQSKVITGVQRRIGWLLMLFFTGTLTSFVLQSFNWVDDRFPHLRFDIFIPLLIGTGGNAGSQTVGTIIRGIALGEIQGRDTYRVLFREWLTGTIMGVMLGVLGFIFAYFTHRGRADQFAFAFVISFTILGICMWANSVGALVPLFARRLGIDPSLVSAPLISTLVDATGLIIYYLLAIVLLIKIAG